MEKRPRGKGAEAWGECGQAVKIFRKKAKQRGGQGTIKAYTRWRVGTRAVE